MKKLLLIIPFLVMGSNSFGFDVGPDINRYFKDPVTQSKIRDACYQYHSLIETLQSLQEDIEDTMDFIRQLSDKKIDLYYNQSWYLAQGFSYQDLVTEFARNHKMIEAEMRRVLLLQADEAKEQEELTKAWMECETMKQRALDEHEIAEIAEGLEDLNDESLES